MSEDGFVTGEADLLDDGFSRDLGADLGAHGGRNRRWGRRRKSQDADNTSADQPAPPPPPTVATVPSVPQPDEPVPPPPDAEPLTEGEAVETVPAGGSEPSDEALALVAMLTGGKAPGSAEALQLAALLMGTEPSALPVPEPSASDYPTGEPPLNAEVTVPAPTFLDDEPLGSLDLPWLDEPALDEEPAPDEEPVSLGEPAPDGDELSWLAPMLMGPLPDATGAMPPPPTGERLAGPEELPPPPTGERLAGPEVLPPPPNAGDLGHPGDEPADNANVFDLFGWPPPPPQLDGDDIRSLNDTRPFPLPVGNHTAVHDLSALLTLDQAGGTTQLGQPPAGGADADAGAGALVRERRRLTTPFELGDQIFRKGAWAGGLSVLVIMAVVGLFLTAEAFTALRARGWRFLTTEEWQPDSQVFGIAAVLFYTVAIAMVALVVAVPLATGTALFITEMAPRKLRSLFVAMVDLMAAVPSIVYGLWGLFFLQGRVIGLSRWLAVWLGWIPFFKVDGLDPSDPTATQSVFTAGTFIAGLVVGLMVVPISCSIMREVFSQAPPGEREGAFALGATRWGMVRTVVLPFGRGGMIGAIMLGLGRALGETIAVYLLISPVFDINWHVLQTGSNSVSTLIVLRQGDASGFGLSALMAAGLALFIMTLIVNFGASTIVARSRSGALSEA